MSITVCIKVDDQGAITVGLDENESASEMDSQEQSQEVGMTDLSQPQSAESGEGGQMQSVKSIKDALQVAGDLLRTTSQQSAALVGGEAGGAGAQQAADAAFQSRRGVR